MTVGEAQRHGENVLRRAGIESLRIDACLLLEKVSGKPRSWLFAHAEAELEDAAANDFMDLVNRRRERVPLVHLTNRREFYGLDFFVDERVLTPRVETETMVDFALRYAPPNSRLIDIGTGSGALAVAIKTHRPDLDVWATDVSDEALEVAKENAYGNNTGISVVKSDLWEGIGKTFATVVTNLPYLRDDAELMAEVQKEPGVALFGGIDGLDVYRKFLQQLPEHLEPGGFLFTECDPWQHEALINEAALVGLKLVEKNDYFILGFQRS